MEHILKAIKKIIHNSVLFFIGLVMIFGVPVQATFAQTINQPSQNTQGSTFLNGNQQQGGQQASGESIVGGVTGCAASVVGSVVSGLISQLTAKYAGSDAYTRVGITSSETVAKAGDSNGYYPSLDSIGYCIINAVLEYITQATVDWINSGFDGNPAFVEDPEKFFGDIAENETANFLQQIVGQATGIDICQPFRLQIVTGLSGGAGGSQFSRQARCGFDDMKAAIGGSGVDFDYQAYTSGSADYSGSLDIWQNIYENDQNNPHGAGFLVAEELQKRLAIKQNTATLDLTMGKGFLSFKSCTKDSTTTDPDGNTVPVKGTCRTTTPGGVIEDQVNRSLGAGRDRLLLADKFDQIITALVNQLIKTALNEVLADDEE
jgi:hypothetical protein